MSDKKFPAAQAMTEAERLMKLLGPYVHNITVAGSLRRGRDLVSDIELLFVPKLETEPDGLFDTKSIDLAAKYIESLHTSGLLGKRLNSAGYISAWGPKNKLAIHIPSGIPVDFFSTTPENWWVSLVIRTGSKETNLRLTTGAQAMGRTLHAYGDGVTEKRTGRKMHAACEQDVFKLCGVPYLIPSQR